MEQGLHTVLLSIAWCILIFIYFVTFGRRRKVSTTRVSRTVVSIHDSRSGENLLVFVTDKLTKIGDRLNKGVESQQGIVSIGLEIRVLSEQLAADVSSGLTVANFTAVQKRELLNLLKSLDEKTSSVLTQLEHRRGKLLDEKSGLESELNKRKHTATEIRSATTKELEELKQRMSGLIEECSRHNEPSLNQEISLLKSEYENIVQRDSQRQQEYLSAIEQTEVEQVISENIRADEQIRKRLVLLDDLRQKNELIRDGINNLKKEIEKISLLEESAGRDASRETLKLREQIHEAELEIEKFNVTLRRRMNCTGR